MMKTPGELIKEARIARGWTQQDLATAISQAKRQSISRAAIAQWENGSSKTQKPENLMAAADVLGFDLRKAIKGESSPAAPVSSQVASLPAVRPHYDKTIAKIVHLLEQTDAIGRAIALSHVQLALANYRAESKANRAK
jgi:transcriptional regulator with XRE-family HTH domain